MCNPTMQKVEVAMANPKHLRILKHSVNAWNKWRRENVGELPNLSGASLKGANLKGANLIEANLIEANLQEANLKEANLKEAKLIAANLIKANLIGANLQGAKLTVAKLIGANLQGANLKEANLKEANFQRAKLQEASLQEVELQGANLQRANLQGANLQRANLQRANLSAAVFDNSDLRYANLENVDITGASLYATARFGWKIDGIICEYIYFDQERKERQPTGREFKSGEFERHYRSIPTIEIIFEQGIGFIDQVVLSHTERRLQSEYPKLGVELLSLDKKGLYPQAVFGFLDADRKNEVQKLLLEGVERENKMLREDKAYLQQLITCLTSKQALPSPPRSPSFKATIMHPFSMRREISGTSKSKSPIPSLNSSPRSRKTPLLARKPGQNCSAIFGTGVRKSPKSQ